MKKFTSFLFLLIVAVASVSAQPSRARPAQTLGLLPYMEQSNLLTMQDFFVTELKARLKGTNMSLMLPKETLARFKRASIDPRKYVANPKAFTGSDEELGALIAWIQAQKGQKGKPGKVRTQLIDTSTGEVVWADEVRAADRESIKRVADRLAVAVKQRIKSKT